ERQIALVPVMFNIAQRVRREKADLPALDFRRSGQVTRPCAARGARIVPYPEPPTMIGSTPSPPSGAERAGVRWGIPERASRPTSPSQRHALGPSLSPPEGRRGGFHPP